MINLRDNLNNEINKLKLININEACDKLGISRATFYNLREKGQLPKPDIDGKYYYEETFLKDFMFKTLNNYLDVYINNKYSNFNIDLKFNQLLKILLLKYELNVISNENIIKLISNELKKYQYIDYHIDTLLNAFIINKNIKKNSLNESFKNCYLRVNNDLDMFNHKLINHLKNKTLQEKKDFFFKDVLFSNKLRYFDKLKPMGGYTLLYNKFNDDDKKKLINFIKKEYNESIDLQKKFKTEGNYIQSSIYLEGLTQDEFIKSLSEYSNFEINDKYIIRKFLSKEFEDENSIFNAIYDELVKEYENKFKIDYEEVK